MLFIESLSLSQSRSLSMDMAELTSEVDVPRDVAVLSMCSKYGFGVMISEGIIDYALNVMLLVQCDNRRVVMVSSWGDV